MCVHDSKVGAYLQPFFMRSKGEATREWESVVNNPETQFHKYPGDFTLFEIGIFDEETGNIKVHEAKISYGTALEYHKPDTRQLKMPGMETAEQITRRVQNITNAKQEQK